MFQREDLSQYKDKETLINGIRSKRATSEQQHDQSDGRTPNFSEAVRRAVSTDESNYRGNQEEGRREAPTILGTNGSTQNSAGSPDRFSSQLRSVVEQSTGSDSSTYQPQRPAAKRGKIKDTYARYKQALAPEKAKPDEKKRTASGTRLTDAEAIKLRPKLIEYALWQSEHLDQFIIATTKGHDESIEIWSNLTRDEAEIIVDFFIARGKADARIAHGVRLAATIIDRIKLGIIVAPRMYATLMIYMQRGFSIR